MAASINNMACVGGSDEIQQSISSLPAVDLSNVHNYPCDIYAGCVTGYLKGCFLASRSHHNLNELQNVNSSLEIKCMTWKNYNESEIITGQRDNSIVNYSMGQGKAAPISMDLPNDVGIIRNLKSHDHLIMAAFSKGLIKCQTIDAVDENTVDGDLSSYEDIEAGSDLFCMDHNRYFPSLILSGGKENPLKIWDLSTPNTPLFTAKNVRNDWLNLTVPTWVTKAEFFSQSKKVVTGTAKAHIRMYDPSSPQRRPVIDIDSQESSPITALALRPNSDFQVIAGTGKGSLFSVDLRKKAVVKNYKGVKGGVTDLKFHPTMPFFATSSIDRHVYCFDADAPKHAKCSSVYAVSQINCLLFSSLWTSDKKVVERSEETADNISRTGETQSSAINGSDEEEETEGLWDSMSVVKTKRKSPSANETPKKRKRRK